MWNSTQLMEVLLLFIVSASFCAGSPIDWTPPKMDWDAFLRSGLTDLDAATSTEKATVGHVSMQAIPDGKCGDGSQAYYVMLQPEEDLYPDKFFVEFMGGSVCVNKDTCLLDGLVQWMSLKEAMVRQAGGDEALFNIFASGLAFPYHPTDLNPMAICSDEVGLCGSGIASWPFDSTHPMHGRKGIWITQCAADLLIGHHTCQYADGFVAHHHGGIHTRKLLDWIKEDFPELSEVSLFGGSGGGVAAQVWAPKVADMWPEAKITVFGDSAFHILPGMELWKWFYDNACWSSGPAGTPEGNQVVIENIQGYDTPTFNWSSPDAIADSINDYEGRIEMFFFQAIRDKNVQEQRKDWGYNTPEFATPIPWQILPEDQTALIFDFLENLHSKVHPGLVASYISDSTFHHATAHSWREGDIPGFITGKQFFYNTMRGLGVGCCEPGTTQKLWYTDTSVCQIGTTAEPTPAPPAPTPACLDDWASLSLYVGILQGMAPGLATITSCSGAKPLCYMPEVMNFDVGAIVQGGCCDACQCVDSHAGIIALAGSMGLTVTGCVEVAHSGYCALDPVVAQTCCHSCSAPISECVNNEDPCRGDLSAGAGVSSLSLD